MIRFTALALCIGMTCAASAAEVVDTCRARSADILQALQQGDYAVATTHFDERAKAALGEQKLGQVWRQMLPQQFGAFEHAAATQVQPQEGRAVAATPLRFANGWLVMRVTCDADGKVSGLFFAPGQAPAGATASPRVDAAGTRETPLAVPSPFGLLPGTLTLPVGAGPFPAVLLVAGSGPHDGDETIGPNKPFRDLAQGLAKAGVASLRYDKRTLTYGAQIAAQANVTVDDEVTDDALAALQLLGQQKSIDPKRLFVLGHSLGAMMAPRIGRRAPQLAGLILLAAPAQPLLEIAMQQVRYLGQQQGWSDAQLEQHLAPLRKERELLDHADPKHPPAGSFAQVPQSYWMSLHGYDPVDAAKSLPLPMLVLQGRSDFQVMPQYNFARWQATFAHSSGVQLREYPGLSHLFMPAGHPPSVADYQVPGHVDARVIGDIVNWIKAQPGHF